jgi:hypothetical protein
MDEIERYVFDTQGCLVLPDILDADEVARLLAGIPRDAQGNIITAENAATFRGLLDLEEPLFRALIAHPALVPRLEAILSGVAGDPAPDRIQLSDEYGLVFERGRLGPWFHNGGTPHHPWLAYHARDGRIHCGLVGVVWALTDVQEGDGGFWYIPGSHKAAFPLPGPVERYERILPCAVQPALRAGSVIIFTEGLTHGTRNWTAPYPRIALFYKYLPGHMAHPRHGTSRPLTPVQERWLSSPKLPPRPT